LVVASAGGVDALRILLAGLPAAVAIVLHRPPSGAAFYGADSHVGNAAPTEMSVRGEQNVGQLCRTKFHNGVSIVGLGTDRGTVAAASNWDEPMQRMNVRPAHASSYERVLHEASDRAFMAPGD
jgi:erythromycin esterase-like protein